MISNCAIAAERSSAPVTSPQDSIRVRLGRHIPLCWVGLHARSPEQPNAALDGTMEGY